MKDRRNIVRHARIFISVFLSCLPSFQVALLICSDLLTLARSFRLPDLENPYWKTFDPYVIPLLDREMDLRRLNELDTSSSEVKVEKDAGLWEKVKEHQTY